MTNTLKLAGALCALVLGACSTKPAVQLVSVAPTGKPATSAHDPEILAGVELVDWSWRHDGYLAQGQFTIRNASPRTITHGWVECSKDLSRPVPIPADVSPKVRALMLRPLTADAHFVLGSFGRPVIAPGKTVTLDLTIGGLVDREATIKCTRVRAFERSAGGR